MDHSVQVGNHLILVCQQGKIEPRALGFLDILRPVVMGVERVDGDPDQLYTATGELVLTLREGTELCGTDGGVVGGV